MPRRREEESVYLILSRKNAVEFRKTKVVIADTESETKPGNGKGDKLVARREALVFLDRSDSEKVNLTIFWPRFHHPNRMTTWELPLTNLRSAVAIDLQEIRQPLAAMSSI
jgi:hypothetical protein